jgi:6-phosphogluconolactonase (cycloisomerase 2 family)
MSVFRSYIRGTVLAAVLIAPMMVSSIAVALTAPDDSPANGVLYVMTNRAEGNTVLVFRRDASGNLVNIQEAATRGLGTGFTLDPLQSQGSLTLSTDGKLLFAVNAGSGDLTAFVVTGSGLQFGSKVFTGGALPVSVTESNGVVYVVNQLGITDISGFRVDTAGHLQPMAGSARALAGKALAQPAQVSFTPDGTKLLVTEKGTDLIDTFHVGSDGRLSGPEAQRSSGHTPFGFAYADSTVLVAEAERRLPMRATVSSYRQTGDSLVPESNAVPDHQGAACWITVTGDTAWVVNTGTSNISSYHVASDGTLTLLNPIAGSTGANTGPIDLIGSSDGNLIYVLESAVGSIAVFRVNGDSLTLLSTKPGLPLSIQGIAIQ